MRLRPSGTLKTSSEKFQYRKRYEVTCDPGLISRITPTEYSFNTASGMRSHATGVSRSYCRNDTNSFNTASGMRSHATRQTELDKMMLGGFNTASGMRSHATTRQIVQSACRCRRFNTASGMRSHATYRILWSRCIC